MTEIKAESQLKVVATADLEQEVLASLAEKEPTVEEGMQRILANIVHHTDEIDVISSQSDGRGSHEGHG